MSYTSFIPTVWASGISRDLERKCVFVEDCYRKYEGQVSRMGESVTICGIGKPTVHSGEGSDTLEDISPAETLDDYSVVLPIDHVSYYNMQVNDVDKAQAIDGLLETMQDEATSALANEVDRFVANLALDDDATVLGSTKAVTGVADENEMNVLDILDEMHLNLMENDVTDSTEIVVTVDPRFFAKFRKEYRALDTDNSDVLKAGKIAYYNGMKIKVSNNLAKVQKTETVGETSVTRVYTTIMARTKKAIAFVNPLTHTEAYRPESSFSDAVKGFVLYGAKIVRPEELCVYHVRY